MRLLDELGRGGFGIVYKARDSKGEKFAVKRLLQLGKARKRVKNELEIVGEKLQHPNIVALHSHFKHEEDVYIVMEFCKEGNLGDYMVKYKPKLSDRYQFMVDIAKGLCFLHIKAIIHRDIKPENILLKQSKDRKICKITDFGLSRVKKRRDQVFISLVGTEPYLAPEIIDGCDYDNSVDVFALGLVFYALMNNVVVYDKEADGKAILAPAAKILSKTRFRFLKDVLRKENTGIDDFVDTYFENSVNIGKLVYSMIQQNPEDRPTMDLVVAEVASICTLTHSIPIPFIQVPRVSSCPIIPDMPFSMRPIEPLASRQPVISDLPFPMRRVEPPASLRPRITRKRSSTANQQSRRARKRIRSADHKSRRARKRYSTADQQSRRARKRSSTADQQSRKYIYPHKKRAKIQESNSSKSDTTESDSPEPDASESDSSELHYSELDSSKLE